jgi:hypothetical protein
MSVAPLVLGYHVTSEPSDGQTRNIGGEIKPHDWQRHRVLDNYLLADVKDLLGGAVPNLVDFDLMITSPTVPEVEGNGEPGAAEVREPGVRGMPGMCVAGLVAPGKEIGVEIEVEWEFELKLVQHDMSAPLCDVASQVLRELFVVISPRMQLLQLDRVCHGKIVSQNR